jgi:hypothetical protein
MPSEKEHIPSDTFIVATRAVRSELVSAAELNALVDLGMDIGAIAAYLRTTPNSIIARLGHSVVHEAWGEATRTCFCMERTAA